MLCSMTGGSVPPDERASSFWQRNRERILITLLWMAAIASALAIWAIATNNTALDRQSDVPAQQHYEDGRGGSGHGDGGGGGQGGNG